jgi:spore maturation protein CgeB
LAPALAWSLSNTRLLALAKRDKPDIILLFKAMDILPRTLRRLRKAGIKLVNYNPDHPFDFAFRGSGNANVANSVPVYDLYLTYSSQIEHDLRRRCPGVRTAIIPFGHQVDEETYAQLADIDEVPRACFVGYGDEARAKKIDLLVSKGIPVDVYGANWARFFKHGAGARVHDPVYGLDMNRTLRAYRLQLNFFRPHNIGSHNMRSFEVPAVGGIMLAPDSQDHRAFFKNGTEAFFYSNDDEMVRRAHEVLSLPRENAAMIRKAARARCLAGGYSYRDRATALLRELEKVLS